MDKNIEYKGYDILNNDSNYKMRNEYFNDYGGNIFVSNSTNEDLYNPVHLNSEHKKNNR